MAFKSLYLSLPKKTLIGAAAALTLLSAQASPVSLSYNGAALPGSHAVGAKASGFGTFTTLSGNYFGDLALDDLASFDFTLTFTYGGLTDTLHYGLDQVESFAVSINDQGFQSLFLRTSFVRGDHHWSQAFGVDGLGANDAYSYNFDIPGDLSTGQIKARLEPSQQIPEPASLALTLGALGLAACVARKKQGAARV